MRFLLIVIMSIFTTNTIAQQTTSPKQCSEIVNNEERLSCYDFLFKPAQLVDDTDDFGEWKIRTEKSKFDDSLKVFLHVRKTNSVTDRFGNDKDIALVLRCQENTTSAFFVFDTFMSDNNGRGIVEYRLDKDKKKTVSMTESGDNQALGLWRGGSAIPFIRQLLNKKAMVVRATPFSESPMTIEFNISNLENAIKPLAEACNWKL